jgi:MoaA/NifB/PqqE/SkfB family radical SAM enzyme
MKMASSNKTAWDALDTARSIASLFSTLPKILTKSNRPIEDYVRLLVKMARINRGAKLPIYGSADITNRCNLRCVHCYWWKNRKASAELTPAGWSRVIDDTFIKNGIYQVALTGGEPLLRPDVIKVFSRKMPKKFVIVTNGTLELKRIKGLLNYFVSIDGTREVHDRIRGQRIYDKVKDNVSNYKGPVFLNMTINSLNAGCLEDMVEDWRGVTNLINFQFHTPFSRDDRLWVPYGRARDNIVGRIRALKKEYPGFFLNTDMQLENLRGNAWTKDCPSWAFLPLDSTGRRKSPCFIGGERKPMCERCGMCETAGMHAGIYKTDLEWFNIFNRNVSRAR